MYIKISLSVRQVFNLSQLSHILIAIIMFSFVPSSDSRHVPLSAYSYGRPARPQAYSATGYPYSYERALAEEQAARRAAAEQEARARLARQYAQWSEDDDDDDGYGQHDYVYGLSPRERAYADVRRREALNRERARKIAEEQRKQAMEEMSRRERESRRSEETVSALSVLYMKSSLI